VLENDRRDARLVGGDEHVAQHLGLPTDRHPLPRGQGSVVMGDVDDFAESDGIRPAQDIEVGEELLFGEPAIGEERHVDRLGQDLVQALDQLCLVLVPAVLQRRLAHRLPQQQRCSSVRRHQVHRNRCLVVRVELGPV
jgi:hypothetical protein